MKHIILVILILFVVSQSFAQDPGFMTFQNEEDTIKKEVKVYPNPCKNNKVTIDYSSKDISEIRLTNITGKQVFIKEYDLPTPRIQLRLNEIPNGIYLIQIKTTDDKHTVKKLLISRN